MNSAGKNCAWKSDEIWCPFPEKIYEYAPDMKQFQKAYLRPFPGLNVLTFLYLVDIQPNSNLHPPPPKLSGSAPDFLQF